MIFDFNNDWLFCRQDGEPKTVTLPHDAMLRNRGRKTATMAKTAAIFPVGNIAMKKHFAVPKNIRNRKSAFCLMVFIKMPLYI